jgi:hypothetical protein
MVHASGLIDGVVTKCSGISTIDSSSTNLCAMHSFDHVLTKKKITQYRLVYLAYTQGFW